MRVLSIDLDYKEFVPHQLTSPISPTNAARRTSNSEGRGTFSADAAMIQHTVSDFLFATKGLTKSHPPTRVADGSNLAITCML